MTQNKVIEHESSQACEVQTITPLMTMVEQAISRGASFDIVSKLMDAQDRHDAKMARRSFDAAMSQAMAEMPKIIKSNTVSFGKTNYKYEDLASIADAVKPILEKYGLSYRFRTGQNGSHVSVTCIVSHKDGYSEENMLSAPNDNSGNKNGIQAIGSTVTYLERYTLKAALGLAVSNDDDGSSYQEVEAQPVERKSSNSLKKPDENGENAWERLMDEFNQDVLDVRTLSDLEKLKSQYREKVTRDGWPKAWKDALANQFANIEEDIKSKEAA